MKGLVLEKEEGCTFRYNVYAEWPEGRVLICRVYNYYKSTTSFSIEYKIFGIDQKFEGELHHDINEDKALDLLIEGLTHRFIWLAGQAAELRKSKPLNLWN